LRIVESPEDMQSISDDLRIEREKIGFVPTMGAFHEGHLSLIRAARKACSQVVVSLFVNPTQFGPGEDFAQYPRTFDKDKSLAEEVGVDFLFAPPEQAVYSKEPVTYVEVERLTKVLCGMSRPAHFRGVTTIVAKLFNIVRPHKAFFGQKDAQQTAVIRKMVEDLNMGIEIVELPIVREPGGLAMSSRNQYLSPEERKDALALHNSLQEARRLVRSGERDATTIVAAMARMIRMTPNADIDYIEAVDASTLEMLDELKGEVLIALAVRIGSTRLIDNIKLKV
jgi:pantoate--beta-alanine ligase